MSKAVGWGAGLAGLAGAAAPIAKAFTRNAMYGAGVGATTGFATGMIPGGQGPFEKAWAGAKGGAFWGGVGGGAWRGAAPKVAWGRSWARSRSPSANIKFFPASMRANISVNNRQAMGVPVIGSAIGLAQGVSGLEELTPDTIIRRLQY